MRLFKMFGLAVLAAVAAMALAGAGTAAAETDVVCKENATPCPVEKILKQGEHQKANGTKIKAIAKLPRLKVYKAADQAVIENELRCEESVVEGWYNEKGTQLAPQHVGEITSLKFTGCIIVGQAGSTCSGGGGGAGEIKGIQLPYVTLLSWTEKQDGKLIISEQLNLKQPGAEIRCTVFGFRVLNCTYKVAETDPQVMGEQNVGRMQVFGGNPAIIEAKQLELKFEGPQCKGAQKAKWDAKYEVTEPKEALFVSKQAP